VGNPHGVRRRAELTSATIRNLLGGDGLLVDTSKVAAYLAELDPRPSAPPKDTAEVDEGRAVFTSDCAPTLDAALAAEDHGSFPWLDDENRRRVIAYLETR